MSEYPIRFNDEMVRAYLAGRKTQHRLPMNPQPEGSVSACESYHPTRVDRHGEEYPGAAVFGCWDDETGWKSPFGGPGDLLWGRECWRPNGNAYRRKCGPQIRYRADDALEWRPPYIERNPVFADDNSFREWLEQYHNRRWWPSVHMPRWASRITPPVKRVWLERVQDISEEDAIAEGLVFMRSEDGLSGWGAGPQQAAPPMSGYSFRNEFLWQWDSIYATKGFPSTENPWLWACEFERQGKA